MDAYQDTTLSAADRAADLVGRMTLEEKVSQMVHGAAAIPRLNVPAYDWWNECLHGVGRAGTATVFPQAIALAATFDTELHGRVAAVISDEARAKHHEFLRKGDRGIYKGLTYWSPNINIFRDPRWGRGHETYGEDPYLAGRLAVAFIKGLQGDHPKYLKLVATAKHYAVHSGPESLRHSFDAQVSPKDLRETYLPAFRDAVMEAGVYSVMGAYNRTNGEPCCASPTLLQKILREEWGFTGYVVSDCGAICDIDQHHRVTATTAQSAALGVRNGCDLNCGHAYNHLLLAVREGLVTEGEIDTAVTRLMEARFRLGMFDKEEEVPYASIPYEINDCDAHRALALEAAQKSFVLLKNRGGVLPLHKNLNAVAVIGPTAADETVLLGNYNGTPSRPVTLLRGIQDKVSSMTRVYYAQGSALQSPIPPTFGSPKDLTAEAISAAERADAVILCVGNAPCMEGEEGENRLGDREHIELPEVQRALIRSIAALGKPVVLVLTGGSAIALGEAAETADAILQVWYPGGEGGRAVADALFGDVSPCGRLPITFYKSTADLPEFTDYRMDERTYRFFKGTPLYPFGFGLSYTQFAYSDLRLSARAIKAGEPLQLSVAVENAGSRACDEVVQLYITDMSASVRVPVRQLAGVCCVALRPGQRATLCFTLSPRQMAVVDEAGRFVLEGGAFRIDVGGCQPDARSRALGATPGVSAEFTMEGDGRVLPA